MPNGKETEQEGPVILKDFSGGLNQTASPLDLAENECLEAYNVKFFRPDGCISPRPGRKWMIGAKGNLMTSAMSSDIIGIAQFHTSAGTTFPMIATCCAGNIPALVGHLSGNSTDGALFHNLLESNSTMHYDWAAGGWYNAVSGMSGFMFSADTVHFAPYENQLIMTWCPSGADERNVGILAPPLLWDGVAGSAVALHISSEPLLGPEDDRSTGSADRQISTLLAVSAARVGTFKGYLFLMNTVEMEMMSSDGSGTGYFSAAWHPYRVRWNNPGAMNIRTIEPSAGGPAWNYNDHADFDIGDGYGLTGYAILGDEMLIFKRNKTYAVSWVGGDEIFTYRDVSDTVGCISHKSIVAGEGVAAWVGKDGIYVYDGTKPVRISDKIKNITQSINVNRRFLACGGAWPELKQVWWSVPVGTSDRNNQGIIWDVHKGDPTQAAWSTATLSVGNLMEYDKTVPEDSAVGMWGTCYGGLAHRYDEAINYETSGDHTDATGVGTKVSAGMAYSWKSGWSTFDRPDHIKRIKRVRTVFDTRSDLCSMAVRRNWETDGTPIVRSARNMSGRGPSTYAGRLLYDKANFTCQGQALQLQYYTSAGSAVSNPASLSTHHWTIHEIGIDVDLMGTRLYRDV